MPEKVLIDATGVYGGQGSREHVLRVLKEALALVEYTASDARLTFPGLRIEIEDPGTTREDERRRRAG